jgi:hypothetical protein
MSLIVNINPVPWKILDLVKARILKNRATKKKQGINWSTDGVKRGMALQPRPVSKRREQEPSFINSGKTVIYTHGEHRRIYHTTNSGEVGSVNITRVMDFWQIYKQEENQEKVRWTVCQNNTRYGGGGYLETIDNLGMSYVFGPIGDAPVWYRGTSNTPYQGALRMIVYISNFVDVDTGDSTLPIIGIVFVGYGESIVGTIAVMSNTIIPHLGTGSYQNTPYWAWPTQDGVRPEPVNYGLYFPSGLTLPDPLYDVSKLEAMPGYVGTEVQEFSE